jgi:hypothetical protein
VYALVDPPRIYYLFRPHGRCCAAGPTLGRTLIFAANGQDEYNTDRQAIVAFLPDFHSLGGTESA